MAEEARVLHDDAGGFLVDLGDQVFQAFGIGLGRRRALIALPVRGRLDDGAVVRMEPARDQRLGGA